MTVFLNILFALISAAALFGFALYAITPKFTDDDGNAPMGALIGEIIGAIIFAVLAALALFFHWFLFFPIALVIVAAWSFFGEYSHFVWLVMITFILAGWFAAGVELTGPSDLIKLLAGRFVVLPASIVVFWFFASWALKRSADEDDED